MNVMEIHRKQIQYDGAMNILSHGKTAKITGKAVKKVFFFNTGFRSVTLLEEDVKAYYGTVKITGSCSGNRTAGSKSQKAYMDPDLYNAAQKIGNEVRTYNLMTAAYDTGALGDAQHDYDLSLLGMIFGEYDLEKIYEKFMNCKKSGNYLCLLEQYNPKGADYLAELRAQQIAKTGGVI